MTPTRPNTGRRPRVTDIVRGLFSLVALVALLVGLPVLLWFLTGALLPDGVSLDEIKSLLTTHELGAPFFAVVMAIGWLGWLSFALCTLLELPAQLRGRPGLRLPAFGLQQRMAGALISAVLVLLPTGAAMAAPASAAPAHAPTAVSAPVAAAPASATGTTAGTQRATAHTAPKYTVQARDSLSKIALRELGDASRWREIAGANEGRTMADGTTFSPRSVLRPGWQLVMPDGWHPGHREHVVEPGESLWSIAEQDLGSGQDYSEIVALNKGQPQADGHALSDPRLIYPGWTLDLPRTDAPQQHAGADRQGGDRTPDAKGGGQHGGSGADHGSGSQHGSNAQHGAGGSGAQHGSDSDKPAVTPAPSQHTVSPHTPSAHTASPHTASPQTPSAKPSQHAAVPPQAPDSRSTARPQPRPEPSHEAPEGGSTAQPQPQPSHQAAADQHDAEDESTGSSFATLAVGATALLAAALLAVIAGRRALQQRRRRPRRRIPVPEAGTPTAALEQQLRVEADVDGLSLLDQALRTLAANCTRAGLPLPLLEAVLVTSYGLRLHLEEPAAAVAPFVTMEGRPDLWWCPAHGAPLLTPEEAYDVTAPYPALVSLGETPSHEPVLVNLESIRMLYLTGDEADVRAVLLGMAVELASSGLSNDTEVVLAGLGEELSEVFPVRIQHFADVAEALPGLRSHDAVQRAALTDDGFDSLAQARLSPDGGDAWVPRILLAPFAPTAAEEEELYGLLTALPATAAAVVTSANGAAAPPGAWWLPTSAGELVSLPDLGLEIVLQRLEADIYPEVVQLLATAARSDDVPGPAWALPPEGDAGESADPASVGPASPDAYGPEESFSPPAESWAGAEPEPVANGAVANGQSGAAAEFDDGDSALSPATGGTSVTQVPAVDPRVAIVTMPGAGGLVPTVTGGDPYAGDDAGYESGDDAGYDQFAYESDAEYEGDGADSGPVEESPAAAWQEPAPEVEPAAHRELFEQTLAAVLDERARQADLDGEPDEEASALSPATLGHPVTAAPAETGVETAAAAAAAFASGTEAAAGSGAATVSETETETETETGAVVPHVRPQPRVTAVTSRVLAALGTEPDPPAAPQVRVLGSVGLIGTLGKVESNRRNGLTEIAAWLALHPGKSRYELDEAIWPGLRVRADTRNTSISKLRAWVGRDPLLRDDDPHGAYLPPVSDGVYAFGPQVTSDWSRFQELYRAGMFRTGTDADVALATALALVRGRPFSDIDQSKYAWAEYDIQEMISTVVDVAHELAVRRLGVGDHRAAAAAASRGLLCDQQSEILYRDLFSIYSATGDRRGIERTTHQLTRIDVETGYDSSPETVALTNALMEANRIASA